VNHTVSAIAKHVTVSVSFAAGRVVQLNTHMLAGFCISTQEARLPPVDVETTIQDIAQYNKFHTSH